MAITRVWVEDICIACGTSELLCPELFKVDHDIGMATVLVGVDFAPIEEKIREAAECCPVQAIQYEEEKRDSR